MTKQVIKIGNAGGYWGDDPFALDRQLDGGPLDYITMDFLAEVTMSILRKQKIKDPKMGYAKDFVVMAERVLEKLLKNKTCLISNAGGMNPVGCAGEILKIAEKKGLKIKIAVVHGDDVLDKIELLSAEGSDFKNLETGEDFSNVKDRICAANVYFGAYPVVEALRLWKPDMIITGRVTDTGITLAPMIYEFGWSFDDWDKLAAGTIAGHLIECGSQVTGGNYTDWEKVKSFTQMGYPVIEMSKSGDFVLTKHNNTGGLVNQDTVREQLFYEMGDPKGYITPDVVADFSSVTLSDDGKNRVKVSGIKGFPSTGFYKVSMAYEDGFKAYGEIIVCGPYPRKKAETLSNILWERLKDLDLMERSSEYIGWNSTQKSLCGADDGVEILLKVGARAKTSQPLQEFSKTVPALILGGPAGVCVTGGVQKPQSVISFWPALIPKELISQEISLVAIDGVVETKILKSLSHGGYVVGKNKDSQVAHSVRAKKNIEDNSKKSVELFKLCLARSGDKGDSSNIGVLARSDKAYEFIKKELTAQKIKDIFSDFSKGTVTRYELPNLFGLNFILEKSLGGGGSCSLRVDPQGKMFSQSLLRQKVNVEESFFDGEVLL